MTATFGKLQGRSLELGDGLNIIEAPNETGKSTWCAFLLSILYGVNSRERDRAGFIADKNRFAPWSGAAMSGRMDCGTELGELTLTRATRRQASPMGEFSAVYAGTNEPVPGLTGAACGETLLGISREVFERSAFIRQNNLPISQDAELERRIAALISSGEEGTSYTEAADALKKQLNRRRHNRTGQLPALETELAELDRQLSESNSLARQLVQARSEVEALSRRAEILQAELTDCNRWEAAQRRQALSGAASAAEQAEVRAAQVQERLQQDQIPENETIARLRGAIVNLETTRRAADKARSERDEAMKALLRAEAAVNESPFAGQSPESARREAAGTENEPVKWNPVPGVLTFLIGVPLCFVVTYAVLFLTGSHSKLLALLTMLAGFSCVCALALFLKKRAFQAGWAELRLKRFGTADLDAIRQLAEDYAKLCEARDAAQASVNAKSAAADTLYSSLSSNEQGILLEVRRFAPAAFDIPTADQVLRQAAQRRKALSEAQTAAREAQVRLDLLVQQGIPDSCDMESTPPLRSRETVADALAQAQVQLAAARSATDRLTGQLHAMGDPDGLRAFAESLQSQTSQLQEEYDALRLAMDTLTDANTVLQNRFSPQLSRRTAEIFHDLTEGRYTAAALDRSFHLTARPAGDPIDRDIQLLSAGAADQLYLSARLAICELVLPPEKSIPIILDDALTNFDDERCAAALRWLKQAAAHRQILLFTCHSREADFFAGDLEVAVQRL